MPYPDCDLPLTLPISRYNANMKTVNVSVIVYSSTAGVTVYRNGTVIGTGTNTDTARVIMNRYIGRAYQYDPDGGRDTRFLGDIAEIVAYNRALAESSRIAVQNYLKSHWSVSF